MRKRLAKYKASKIGITPTSAKAVIVKIVGFIVKNP